MSDSIKPTSELKKLGMPSPYEEIKELREK